MKRNGPPPTPTPILQARGSWRAKDRESEPQFDGPAPLAPAHLDADARKEWLRLAPVLEATGLLTLADRAALAAYCQAYSRWVKAEREVAKRGEVLMSPKAGLYQNPWLFVANKALEQMHKFGMEFGFSPAARARLKAPDKASGGDESKSRFFPRGA